MPFYTLPNSIHKNLNSTSWYELQFDNIIKQKFDYSCGAASLATIINYFNKLKVTEIEILKSITDPKTISFNDLKSISELYGFNTYGLEIDHHQLQQLKIPAIIYIKDNKIDHFTVYVGVDSLKNIYLADPTWGHTKLSEENFIKNWITNNNKGKVLLLIPKNKRNKYKALRSERLELINIDKELKIQSLRN